MQPTLTTRLGTRLCASIAVLLMMAVGADATEIYRPKANTIVLRIDGHAALTRLRHEVEQNLSDIAALSRYVNALIERAALSGDERYYGFAEQALNRAPPALRRALAVTHAQLLQQRHEFAGAEALLGTVLERDSTQRDARLMRAQVRLHLKNADGAMRDCVAVMPHVDLLIGASCVTQARVAMQPDNRAEIERSYRLLATLLNAHASKAHSALKPEHSWSVGVAAELAARSGRNGDAARWYELAIKLDPRSHYARLAYAEWQEKNRI